jgi:hypothetical protein
MSDLQFIHIVDEWLCGGRRDHPIRTFIAANNLTTLQELHGFLELPSTITQLTHIDPSDQLTHRLSEDQREDLLALPHVLNLFYEECQSIEHAHNHVVKKTHDDYLHIVDFIAPTISFITVHPLPTTQPPRPSLPPPPPPPSLPPPTPRRTLKRHRQRANRKQRRARAASSIQAWWRNTLSARRTADLGPPPHRPIAGIDLPPHQHVTVPTAPHPQARGTSCLTGETPPQPPTGGHPSSTIGNSRGPAVNTPQANDYCLAADMVPTILPPPEPPPEPPPCATLGTGIAQPNKLVTGETPNELRDALWGASKAFLALSKALWSLSKWQASPNRFIPRENGNLRCPNWFIHGGNENSDGGNEFQTRFEFSNPGETENPKRGNRFRIQFEISNSILFEELECAQLQTEKRDKSPNTTLATSNYQSEGAIGIMLPGEYSIGEKRKGHPHYNTTTAATHGELEWILERDRNGATELIWDDGVITTTTTQTENLNQTDLQDINRISSTQSNFAQTPTDSDLNWTWTTFWNSSARITASERHNNAVTSLSSKHWGVTEHSTFRYCWAGRSTLNWNTSPTNNHCNCTTCNHHTATIAHAIAITTSHCNHCAALPVGLVTLHLAWNLRDSNS